ncbi:MAG: PEP-CTERM sorting domain-containing protein [Kiritimatiellae bacterium]|nr:PEP-CTERM sorting domain-containing protein [Kiritimatiellia bacterium]
MKSLFKSLLVSTALLLASTASAGTLYWQASNESGDSFDYALLVAEEIGSGTKSTIGAVASQEPDKTSTLVTQTSLDSLADPEAYLFYVEMVNYTGGDPAYDVVATGYKYGYGDLVSSGYVATGAIDSNAAQAAAAVGNLGSAVPEPSSGLLLLIGGAMLALRRRRQK